MRALFALAIALPLALPARSQSTAEQVQATLDTLVGAMRAADSTTLKRLFVSGAELQSVTVGPRGAEVARMPVTDFIRSVAQNQPGEADERLGRADIHIDGPLATAWVPYTFYLDTTLSHCGTNAITLLEQPKDARTPWRILRVTDTRRRDGDCPPLGDSATLASLDALLDAWHQAAAVADEAAFFGTMSAEGVYLGTDASERWPRDSMAVWAQPYFERDTAWAFTPRDRYWQLSADGQTAWFDELLDGWMGVARGSGVLSQKPGEPGWELRHYNLALTIPNDKMEAVRLAIDSTASPH